MQDGHRETPGGVRPAGIVLHPPSVLVTMTIGSRTRDLGFERHDARQIARPPVSFAFLDTDHPRRGLARSVPTLVVFTWDGIVSTFAASPHTATMEPEWEEINMLTMWVSGVRDFSGAYDFNRVNEVCGVDDVDGVINVNLPLP